MRFAFQIKGNEAIARQLRAAHRELREIRLKVGGLTLQGYIEEIVETEDEITVDLHQRVGDFPVVAVERDGEDYAIREVG